MFELLEGKNVNLRIAEKEDVKLFWEWFNNPSFLGEYHGPMLLSRADVEKMFESNPNSPFEMKLYVIEKKDGSAIGYVNHFNMLALYGKMLEIGYALLPTERGKGYCAEAVQLMVDYLFLSKNTERIQAATDVGNVASQNVLERGGFKKEGTLRKAIQHRGAWVDYVIFSILREEWKEPKILTKATRE